VNEFEQLDIILMRIDSPEPVRKASAWGIWHICQFQMLSGRDIRLSEKKRRRAHSDSGRRPFGKRY